MKKNSILVLFILNILIIFISGCASTDLYKYKDSRMVFKIDVDEPQVKEQDPEIYLIDKKITILPFIDNRNFEKTLFTTDIACSLLLSKTFYRNLTESYVFKTSTFADENFYKNKTLTFDENNFSELKKTLKTDGILWGIIYEFDIVISPDKIQNQYILTLHLRGDVKIMSDNGTITYYHDYNKTRSYTFKSEASFSYSLYDVYSLGPYINNFFEWIVDAEINHLISNSDDFIKGKLAIENLMPDVLTHPQENTKLYDASIITSATLQRNFINVLGSLAGALGGFFVTFNLSDEKLNNTGSILMRSLIGIPLGMLSGYFIINYFSDIFYKESEKKAVFYASNIKSNDIFYLPILNLKL
ncbi:MAG: hypothetical protein N3E50_04270 [Candidatus Goldbacteria bacterium]|nr:hypothetical protein [Candidatus Goldiibacteriota bacterium]